jgi:hypothetical protein
VGLVGRRRQAPELVPGQPGIRHRSSQADVDALKTWGMRARSEGFHAKCDLPPCDAGGRWRRRACSRRRRTAGGPGGSSGGSEPTATGAARADTDARRPSLRRRASVRPRSGAPGAGAGGAPAGCGPAAEPRVVMLMPRREQPSPASRKARWVCGSASRTQVELTFYAKTSACGHILCSAVTSYVSVKKCCIDMF